MERAQILTSGNHDYMSLPGGQARRELFEAEFGPASGFVCVANTTAFLALDTQVCGGRAFF
jgi:hypothetical protein